MAVMESRIRDLEDLILLKPDLEAVDDRGLTALHKAAAVSSSSQIAIMNLLIGAGAKVDSKDDLGSTPLHHAAWHGCDEAALFLLRYIANPLQKTPRRLYGPPRRAIKTWSSCCLRMVPQLRLLIVMDQAPFITL